MQQHRVLITRLPPAVIDGLQRDAADGVSANEAALLALYQHYGLKPTVTMRPPRLRARQDRIILRVPSPLWHRLAADAQGNGTISGNARNILIRHYQETP